MRRRKMAAQQKAEEARREMLQAEAEKLRKRREEEKAWKRLGVIPTRRVTWKGLVVDVDGTRGIGYYPKILRTCRRRRRSKLCCVDRYSSIKSRRLDVSGRG